MSKHGKGICFSQTWVTKTQLGKHFNMTARAIGHLLAPPDANIVVHGDGRNLDDLVLLVLFSVIC